MASYDDTATVSGSIVRVNDGADSVPLKNWLVTLPANLSGYSEVNAYKAKKNLLDMTVYDGGVYNPDIGRQLNLTVSSSQFTKTGNAYSIDTTTEWKTFAVRMPVKAGVTYYIKYTMSASGETLGSSEYYLDADNKVINSAWNTTTNPYTRTRSSTAPSNSTWFVITFTNRGTATNTLTITEPQIEVGSTATSYEAYEAPTQYTASLGRTIYGGTADIANGVGQESYGYIDLGDFTWVKVTSGQTPYFSTNAPLSPAYVWRTQNNNVVCNNYSYASIGSTGSDEGFFVTDGSYVRIRDSNYESMTASEFKTAITGTILVYELATPTPFTFTPVSIETSKGSNTFWSDQGNTELTYYKDGYGFTSVTIHKETPDGEPVEQTVKLHRIIYEGQVDVISGTGLIYRGESGTEYDPPEQFSFTPIEVSTDEGENTLFADEGDSAITYRKEIT